MLDVDDFQKRFFNLLLLVDAWAKRGHGVLSDEAVHDAKEIAAHFGELQAWAFSIEHFDATALFPSVDTLIQMLDEAVATRSLDASHLEPLLRDVHLAVERGRLIPSRYQQGARQQPPTMEAKEPLGRPYSPHKGTQISIWFGTDRAGIPSDDSRRRFGGARSGDPNVTLGKALVSIPRFHEDGEIERPRWWLLEFREDPADHIVVVSCSIMAFEEWVHDAHRDGNDGLLFIHGYNVTFEAALWRTAQITYDLKFTGIPLLFSWPSAGRGRAYAAYEESAEWSVPHLAEFLTLARSRLGLRRIHVVAHSMGNRVLMRALDRMGSISKEGQAPLGQVVLAAADIGVDVFKQMRDCFQVTEQLTAYASRADRALFASRYIHSSPRLGDANPPIVLPGMETVDVTEAGSDMFGLGHSYFGGPTRVFTDLYYLIRGHRAEHRKSVRKKLPEGYYVLT